MSSISVSHAGDRTKRFTVTVDGEPTTKLEHGETVTIDTAPGEHTVEVARGMCAAETKCTVTASGAVSLKFTSPKWCKGSRAYGCRSCVALTLQSPEQPDSNRDEWRDEWHEEQRGDHGGELSGDDGEEPPAVAVTVPSAPVPPGCLTFTDADFWELRRGRRANT